jgi:hypothetical protein
MMDRRQQLKHEEKKLLLEVFLGDAKTPEEVVCGLRDIALIENGLKLMQVKSLLGFGARGTGRKSMSDAVSAMLDQEIKERYELGLMPLTPIRPSDIASLEYEWNFTHAVKIKSGATKRNYKTRVLASSQNNAMVELSRKLAAKGMKLVEVQDMKKSLALITTIRGDVVPWYAIDLIEEEE